MIHWHCFNCHKDKETENDIIMAFCSCGELMKEVKENEIRRGD